MLNEKIKYTNIKPTNIKPANIKPIHIKLSLDENQVRLNELAGVNLQNQRSLYSR